MSWLSGLAGKAEELLNKVDQSAASLNSSLLSQTSRSNSPKPSHAVDHHQTIDNLIRPITPSSPSLLTRAPAPTLPSAFTEERTASKKSNKKDKDDDLFEFLNSETTRDVKRSSQHSRQSSLGSIKVSGDTGLQIAARPATPAGDGNHSPTDRNSGSSACPSDFEVVDNLASEMTASAISTQSLADDGTIKALELENTLLKNEIQSLNSEMSSLVQRARQAEHDLAESRRTCDSYISKVSSLEQNLRTMRDRDVDQTEAIKVKDSQVSVLRVRLEELEHEVKAKSHRLLGLEQDRERILQDHSDSSGLHSTALENLKKKLEEAEKQLKDEKAHFQNSEKQHIARLSKLENDQLSLSESVVQLQKKLSEEKTRSNSLNNQLKQAKTSSESVKQEYLEYKEKATKILQNKDKLIASLKESGSMSDSLIASEINAEQETEKNLLRQELQQAFSTAESLRMELQDMENQLQTEHDESKHTIENLEDKLRREQSKTKDLEQEMRSLSEELKFAQEQSLSQRGVLQQQIYERDAEIEKLKNQLMSKQLSTASQDELETRLHNLTENLIQKQTLVESLSTERNSLKLQLERSEHAYKEMEKNWQTSSSTTAVYIGEDDGTRHRGPLPAFMKESPTDPEFTKKVKRAANTIDKFSIRLGVFLRRYPIARVFVILYMMLLHFWTMVVLLTYQPEMHGSEHSHLPVPAPSDHSHVPPG